MAKTSALQRNLKRIKLAKKYSKKREELKNIYEAISKNPFLLAGDKRFDTTLITALNKKGISNRSFNYWFWYSWINNCFPPC